jgi:pyruvate oxidase
MRDDVAARWKIWRAEKQSRTRDDSEQGLGAAQVFAALSRLAPANAIVTVDVGNNAYSFGRYFEAATGQSVLMSGYLGSIGFALPAAMGAWAATRESGSPHHGRPVISVSGDGGLGQYLAELTTLVKYDMNITHVLLDNAELAKISKEQRAGHWSVWETELRNPSFAAFAENCGAMGVRVGQPGELDTAMGRAIAHSGPALVEIRSDAALL